MTGLSIEVLTLFPEVVQHFVAAGLLGRAIETGLVSVHCTNIRDFTHDKHRTVDDTPFGGGAGMVMKPEPVVDAMEAVERERGKMHRILLTPSGARFDQQVARRLSTMSRIGLVCGRYEGIDDRVREHFVDECLSIGDFVLGGGEVAALAVIEAVTRLREGVMGNPRSADRESFGDDLLEYPQYTRPAEFRGHRVPPVLSSGDHDAIARWRAGAALRRTWEVRPDLRPPASLPSDLPVYLVIGGVDPSEREAFAAAFSGSGLHGVFAVGASVQDATALARRLGGRPTVAAIPDGKTLRRKLKRAHGAKIALCRVVDPGTPDAFEHAEAVADALCADPPGALVLAAGPNAGQILSPWPRIAAHADFAPQPAGPLATVDTMIDSSRPRVPRWLAQAERAWSLLRRCQRPKAAPESEP